MLVARLRGCQWGGGLGSGTDLVDLNADARGELLAGVARHHEALRLVHLIRDQRTCGQGIVIQNDRVYASAYVSVALVRSCLIFQSSSRHVSPHPPAATWHPTPACWSTAHL